MSPTLSIIIPFGLSEERSYIKDRVIQKATLVKSDEKIEYIFVEGYSSLKNNLKQIIEENGHIYLKDESQKDFFSQGKCRNLGACFANAQVIMFLDVDCYVSSFSLEKILNLIKIKNIAQCINEILVLPVVYLTKEGSDKIYKEEEKLWDDIIKYDLISGKNSLVKFFAPSSTSTIVINKHQFLKLGGNNEKFIGHGYEDFDFFIRVLKSCVKFEKMPFNLNYDSRNWNFKNFKGFRSWFSLLGYEACFYGIYMYHFWHTEPNQNGYMSKKHENHKLFYKHLKNFKDYSIKPLQVASAKNIKILVIGKEINDFQDLSVYLGEFTYKTLDELIDKSKEEIRDYLQQKKFDKIFLDIKLQISDNIKDILSSFEILYFNTGLFSNSWLFYKNMDNFYERKYWDINLTKLQIDETKVYFYSLDSKERQKITDFIKELKINKEIDLYKFIYYLRNEIYSFCKSNGDFYQVIFDKKKLLTIKDCDKVFYSLKSFVYKPYLYELKTIRIFSIILKFLGLNFIQSIISQTKFYRLARKLFFNPKDFFKDSRKINFKKLQ
ncbi:galactosyltransferase-related protein [Campylobacter estrildidarum]|uniref:Sugar transferase n=1 Tax=Campylobacter estrildidarum TaxID=2510189 RepID=A0A4U7BIV6_9BACT|nr:galactosyltransferase-related protein [Campylobacter estrildidarum]TKX28374.1 sugar transferase [Campylobacter estrildidarum]